MKMKKYLAIICIIWTLAVIFVRIYIYHNSLQEVFLTLLITLFFLIGGVVGIVEKKLIGGTTTLRGEQARIVGYILMIASIVLLFYSFS